MVKILYANKPFYAIFLWMVNLYTQFIYVYSLCMYTRCVFTCKKVSYVLFLMSCMFLWYIHSLFVHYSSQGMFKMFIKFLHFLNFGNGSIFIIISAFMSSVIQYCNAIVFSSMFSLMKWWAISICFVHAWFTGWLAKAIIDLLSWLMIVGLSCLNDNSSSMERIQRASFTAVDRAWYSACVVQVATVCCFFVYQEIVPLFIVNK